MRTERKGVLVKRYVALLRGINVGGKNIISMKEVKDLLMENGFQDVATYINSGNIIFSSDSSDIEFLKSHFEDLILQKFDLELTLMIISAEDLIDALSNAPEWWDKDSEAKHTPYLLYRRPLWKKLLWKSDKLSLNMKRSAVMAE